MFFKHMAHPGANRTQKVMLSTTPCQAEASKSHSTAQCCPGRSTVNDQLIYHLDETELNYSLVIQVPGKGRHFSALLVTRM